MPFLAHGVHPIPSTQPRPTQGRRQPCQLSLGRRYWARERAQGVGEDSAGLVMVAWVHAHTRCKVLAIVSDLVIIRPLELLGLLGGSWEAPFGLRARAVIPCRMLEHPLTPAGIEAGTTTPQPSKPPRNGTWSGAPGRQRMGFGCGQQAPSSLPVALWVIARPEREHGVVYSVPWQRWLACQRE